MITLTGVTGNLGGATLAELRRTVPESELAVVVRDPAKVADLAAAGIDVRVGDYDDPASLRAAFAGTDVLLFVSSPDTAPGVRPRQHRSVVEAATAAGVGRVVYTSAIHADDGPGFLADHGLTEDLLRGSGLPYTFLRNTFYLHILVNAGIRDAVSTGELVGAANGQPVNLASVADLAVATAAALRGDGHAGVVHELRGPVWTLPELAAAVADVSGRAVTYREVPLGELGGAAFVWGLVADGLFAEGSPDLEKLLGRPATPLHDAVAAALA